MNKQSRRIKRLYSGSYCEAETIEQHSRVQNRYRLKLRRSKIPDFKSFRAFCNSRININRRDYFDIASKVYESMILYKIRYVTKIWQDHNISLFHTVIRGYHFRIFPPRKKFLSMFSNSKIKKGELSCKLKI